MTTRFVTAIDLDGEGSHPAAWRAARRGPAALLTAAHQRELAQAVEAAGFDLATFADGPPPPDGSRDVVGRLAPIETATFAAHWTTRLALAPTAGAVHAEPFHLSNQLSSLDRASHGRAGWVVDATSTEVRARAFGTATVDDPVALLAEASGVVDAARRLWDSWEDDAIIADSRSGRFLDQAKLHRVDAGGPGYTIRGPALLPRPVQGQVVVIAAPGTLCAGLVDVALVGAGGEGETVVAASAARRDAPRVLAEIDVVLDTPSRSATDRLADLDAATPWRRAGRLRHVGPPDALVASIRRLAPHVDGVRLHPAVLDVDLDILARSVLPALSAASLHRPAVGAVTLREVFALPRPSSRFANPERGSRVA